MSLKLLVEENVKEKSYLVPAAKNVKPITESGTFAVSPV